MAFVQRTVIHTRGVRPMAPQKNYLAHASRYKRSMAKGRVRGVPLMTPTVRFMPATGLGNTQQGLIKTFFGEAGRKLTASPQAKSLTMTAAPPATQTPVAVGLKDEIKKEILADMEQSQPKTATPIETQPPPKAVEKVAELEHQTSTLKNAIDMGMQQVKRTNNPLQRQVILDRVHAFEREHDNLSVAKQSIVNRIKKDPLWVNRIVSDQDLVERIQTDPVYAPFQDVIFENMYVDPFYTNY